jgi:hypothetical protein
MSIYINHDTTSSSSKSQSRVSLLNTADAKAPGSVLCAEFERLQIYLNFYTPALPPRPPRKQAKTCSQEPESPDTMLLDDDPELEKEDHFEDFEDVVGRLSQELSKSIARCFDHFLVPERRDPIPLNSASHIFGPKESASTIFDVTSNNESRSKGGRFPMATTDTLKTWFETHLQHPYPTKEEKRRLMEETGVTDSMLQCSFSALLHVAD